MIKIENFYKKYDSKSDYVVQNVNLQIEPKKITCLLGPNGSGKSTIMNCICGFIYGSKGSIWFSDSNNNLINVEENQSSVMKNIGYVPEISKLPPELKVLEFLTYAAENHNLSKEETLQNIKFLVKKLDLESLLTKKIKTLSKGQQQRVSFAQGLIHNPANLILRFALPLYIGNLFQQFYNLVDTLIVGRTLGVTALAAVGATGSIAFLVLGFILGLTAGFSVITAHTAVCANRRVGVCM